MTLAEKVKEMFGDDIQDKFIGIYEEDENGKVKPIYPDFMDEMLETHGDLEIDPDVYYSKEKKTLVVEFKETIEEHWKKIITKEKEVSL